MRGVLIPIGITTERLEAVVAELWAGGHRDTYDIAAKIESVERFPVSQARVANALARVRDRQHQSQLAEAV